MKYRKFDYNDSAELHLEDIKRLTKTLNSIKWEFMSYKSLRETRFSLSRIYSLYRSDRSEVRQSKKNKGYSYSAECKIRELIDTHDND